MPYVQKQCVSVKKYVRDVNLDFRSGYIFYLDAVGKSI